MDHREPTMDLNTVRGNDEVRFGTSKGKKDRIRGG